MSIEEKVSTYLVENNVVWRLKDGQEINPSDKDVKKFLDNAEKSLYDGVHGDLVVGAGLIVYKTDNGYDVYVVAGQLGEI